MVSFKTSLHFCVAAVASSVVEMSGNNPMQNLCCSLDIFIGQVPLKLYIKNN